MKLRLASVFASVWLGAASLVMAGGAAAQVQPVGQVTLNIGQALVVSASGATEAVRRGSQVHPGDRIETSEGGHVHIRFVDGALVSVRPTSRLVIEDYQYNPQQVAQSLVRFRLEKGVTRAISGAAAEGAKERFRLNTPLVAIGVRGTDFVVLSQPSQTIATVNQGAIVMAPFGEGCSPQAFGPCGSASAKLLSADMGNMLVEFRSTLAQPEIKPLNGVTPPPTLLALADTRPAADAASSREASKPAARSSSDEAVSIALVQEVVRKASDVPAVAPVLAPPVVAPPIAPPVVVAPVVPPVVVAPIAPPVVVAPVVPPVVVAPVVVPPVVVAPVVVAPVVVPPVVVVPVVVPPVVVVPVAPVLPPVPPQLAWGRWGAGPLGATDFSVARGEARAGRVVTVGDNDFILYRTENGPAALPGGLGNVSFDLQQAHAQFNSALGIQAARVDGGSLSINFPAREFNTALSLSSAPTGKVGLQAAGFIREDGMFNARTATQGVAGAIALDGKSVGLLFEKAAAGGTLSGITLWSR